jgi:uncharacterized protein YecT (DUF1311 family)
MREAGGVKIWRVILFFFIAFSSVIIPVVVTSLVIFGDAEPLFSIDADGLAQARAQGLVRPADVERGGAVSAELIEAADARVLLLQFPDESAARRALSPLTEGIETRSRVQSSTRITYTSADGATRGRVVQAGRWFLWGETPETASIQAAFAGVPFLEMVERERPSVTHIVFWVAAAAVYIAMLVSEPGHCTGCYPWEGAMLMTYRLPTRLRGSTGRPLARVTALLAAVMICQPVEADNLENGTATYREADRRLNETYAELRQELAPHTFERLRSDQRQWIKRRDRMAAEVARLYDGAPRGAEANSPTYWQTKTGLTRTRTLVLEAWKSPPRSLGIPEGTWIDGYGGTLIIASDPNRADAILFKFEVVRGATAHTGTIAGRARVNGRLARFTDAANTRDKPADLGETWIGFQWSSPVLEVVAANTSWYHGLRGYFDGRYVRVDDVSDEERAGLRNRIYGRR